MQRLWNWEEKEKKKTIDLEKNIKFMETNVETKRLFGLSTENIVFIV